MREILLSAADHGRDSRKNARVRKTKALEAARHDQRCETQVPRQDAATKQESRQRALPSRLPGQRRCKLFEPLELDEHGDVQQPVQRGRGHLATGVQHDVHRLRVQPAGVGRSGLPFQSRDARDPDRLDVFWRFQSAPSPTTSSSCVCRHEQPTTKTVGASPRGIFVFSTTTSFLPSSLFCQQHVEQKQQHVVIRGEPDDQRGLRLHVTTSSGHDVPFLPKRRSCWQSRFGQRAQPAFQPTSSKQPKQPGKRQQEREVW